MSTAKLSNCRRCNALYKRITLDTCADCTEFESQQFQKLFRLLQRSQQSGGMFAEELSAETGFSMDEIQDIYLEGRLGTAGIFLKFHCRSCSCPIYELTRKGRYCVNCSEKVATEAGVEVKTIQEIQREEEKRKRNKEVEAKFRSSITARFKDEGRRRSGFIRHT